MPYRQGMMVAGDYYGARNQGDVFGFLKRVVGGVAKVAGSVLPGPIGTAAKAVGNIFAPPQIAVLRQNPIGATLPPPPLLSRPLPQAPGNFYGIQAGGTQFGLTTPPHRSFGPLSGTPKKRRRMNVTNVKALRRAGRRVTGFEKLARRFVGFAAPHKPKGRMYFKRSRKRA